MSSTRNNQARLDTTSVDEAPQPAKETKKEQAASLSFAVPTEFVDLPSRGLYYPEGHPLHGVESIEIKHMTAKEEDILSSETLIKKGVAIDRMLQSVMIDKAIKISDMLIGDKNALTVAARVTGYGAEYETRLACPSCDSEQEFEFDLGDLEFVGASFDDRSELNNLLDGVEITDDNTFIITLPKSNHSVELKMLTGADEDKLNKFQNKKIKSQKDKLLPTTLLTDTLKMVIISVSGVKSRDQINQFVDNMPAMDSRYLRGVYQKLAPNIDMTQTFVCGDCGHEQDLEVPVTTDFFWPRQ
tara:strand:- start:14712 stop:15611 length:900 start_codon:yes stop_codon:yes gene_type:complete